MILKQRLYNCYILYAPVTSLLLAYQYLQYLQGSHFHKQDYDKTARFSSELKLHVNSDFLVGTAKNRIKVVTPLGQAYSSIIKESHKGQLSDEQMLLTELPLKVIHHAQILLTQHLLYLRDLLHEILSLYVVVVIWFYLQLYTSPMTKKDRFIK